MLEVSNIFDIFGICFENVRSCDPVIITAGTAVASRLPLAAGYCQS